jgi:hypothetical protein
MLKKGNGHTNSSSNTHESTAWLHINHPFQDSSYECMSYHENRPVTFKNLLSQMKYEAVLNYMDVKETFSIIIGVLSHMCRLNTGNKKNSLPHYTMLLLFLILTLNVVIFKSRNQLNYLISS